MEVVVEAAVQDHLRQVEEIQVHRNKYLNII